MKRVAWICLVGLICSSSFAQSTSKSAADLVADWNRIERSIREITLKDLKGLDRGTFNLFIVREARDAETIKHLVRLHGLPFDVGPAGKELLVPDNVRGSEAIGKWAEDRVELLITINDDGQGVHSLRVELWEPVLVIRTQGKTRAMTYSLKRCFVFNGAASFSAALESLIEAFASDWRRANPRAG